MIDFVFVANIKWHKSSRFLDNVTLLSGDKVSFVHEKATSNTLQYLQNSYNKL